MFVYKKMNNPNDPRPHIVFVPDSSKFFIHGLLTDDIISWLKENVGKAKKDWKLKQSYGNLGRGVFVKLPTEELALAFVLRWLE